VLGCSGARVLGCSGARVLGCWVFPVKVVRGNLRGPGGSGCAGDGHRLFVDF